MSKPTAPAEPAEPEVRTTDSEPAAIVPNLQPHISKRYALSWIHVVACGFFAVLFAILNHIPLHHSDLWGHVLYGRSIIENGEIPTEDPFVPLAAGMKMLDSAWLSQAIFARLESLGGAESLSHLFAFVVTLTYLLLALTFYRQTRRVGLAVTGTLLVLLLASTRVRIIRPEMFGTLCFAGLILITQLAGRSARKKGDAETDSETSTATLWGVYFGVPLLMAFWANTHGSFLIGVAFVGCHLLGRFVEIAWRTRSLRAVLSDRRLRRWLWLTELAVAGTLCNPDLMDAWINALTFSRNPNLQDIAEWQPLRTEFLEAYWLGMSAVILLFVVRHSRLVIRPVDVLLLAVFATALVLNVRMCVWFAFAFGYVIVPHLADLLGRFWPAKPPVPEEEIVLGGGVFGRSFIHTLVCGLLLWCGFALSPVAQPLLGGDRRSDSQLYSAETPLSATAYLRDHPPEGQIWNPQWWGDWLLWAGPDGLQVFSTTNAIHVVPPQVWRDYRRVQFADAGWQTTLDKYRINTIVIDKTVQTQLAERVRSLPSEWRIVFEDTQSIIVSREAGVKSNATE